MKKLFLLAVVAVVAVAVAVPAFAQQKQGDKSFEVIGEVRFRADYSDSVTDFNDLDPNDDAGVIWPWRVRAGFHANFTRNVSGHVEFQNFGFSGDGDNGIFSESGSSGGNTELYQGWVELGNIGGTSFDLRLGRQELVYGSEMLLGDADFYNGVVHDGALAKWQYKNWTLDTFYTQFVENVAFSTGVFPSAGQAGDTEVYGAYATFKAPKLVGFDAYGIVLNDNDGTITGGPREERSTFGGRVYPKQNDSNWDWSAEVAFQTGEFETGGTETDISAVAFEGLLAYQFDVGIKPRVYVRYNSYSGEDDDASDSEAFNPLFQDFHARNGYADVVRAVNLDVLRAGVSWKASEDRHKFGVDILSFTLNEEVTVGGDTEDDLGTEVDLYYKFAYTKNLMIEAAIASFSPGDLFKDAATTPVAGGATAPGLTATNDDSAMRIYGNTRLRW